MYIYIHIYIYIARDSLKRLREAAAHDAAHGRRWACHGLTRYIYIYIYALGRSSRLARASARSCSPRRCTRNEVGVSLTGNGNSIGVGVG